MWTVAQISPITFSEVRLGSAADSNMAAAATARNPRARADERLTGGWFWHVLNMSFTQKRPEIVRNTCARIVKLDCNILFVVFFFSFAYMRSSLSNRWLTNKLSMVVNPVVSGLSTRQPNSEIQDMILTVTKSEKIKNPWKRSSCVFNMMRIPFHYIAISQKKKKN